MMNPIHSSSSSIHPYRQMQPAGEPAARPQAAPAPSRPEGAHPAPGLTAAEQQMIDRYFPESPTLTQHLYNAAGQVKATTPAALGTRLDLRG